MDTVKLGDKVTLSALKLSLWLDDAICDAVEEATSEGIADSMAWARDRVVALFKEEERRGNVSKVTGSEDGEEVER